MPSPRKPTALRVITGNPSRRPLPKNEPKPKRGIPVRPPHLDAYAVEEWERITPELYAVGLLTKIDGVTLAAYCQSVSRWRQAEEGIQRMRAHDRLTGALMIKTMNGNAIQNPLIGVANRAMAMALKIAGEFGMSPAARARFAAMTHDEPIEAEDGKEEGYF
jgi:P27 family predicted phage terminase small subunit